VVDDDPLMVRTLCDVLRRRGYDAQGAASGEEALERAGERAWAAVVMDIRMPGISGVDACKQLRHSRPAVPVILMTAHSEPELLAEAHAAGVSRVLSKPFSIPELLTLLEGSLG
jgi:CheY-like chemotaxis protein